MGFQQSINAGLAAVGSVSKITESVKAQKEAAATADAAHKEALTKEALTLQGQIPELEEQEQSLSEELEAKQIESNKVRKKHKPEITALKEMLASGKLSDDDHADVDSRLEDIGIELRMADKAADIVRNKVYAKRKIREAYEERLNNLRKEIKLFIDINKGGSK